MTDLPEAVRKEIKRIVGPFGPFDHDYLSVTLERFAILAFTEGRRAGLDRAIEYIAGSTFAESERATVESCLSLLESLRHALAGGEGNREV